MSLRRGRNPKFPNSKLTPTQTPLNPQLKKKIRLKKKISQKIIKRGRIGSRRGLDITRVGEGQIQGFGR